MTDAAVIDLRGRASDPALVAIKEQIDELVRSGMTDPLRIASIVVDRLEQDALRIAAVRGLQQIVRSHVVRESPRPVQPSRRWAEARTVDIPVARPDGTWESLAALTPDQLHELERRYKHHAALAEARGRLYGRLAFELQRGGYPTVGDAPRGLVASVFAQFKVPLPEVAA